MAIKFKTKITELLGIEHPILCGGMQWISRAEIVAAVGEAGGIGFITAESLETPEDLREEIKKIRDLTDKPFGINLSMVPEFGLPERTLQFCDVVVEEGVKVVETAGRSPEPLLPRLKEGGGESNPQADIGQACPDCPAVGGRCGNHGWIRIRWPYRQR